MDKLKSRIHESIYRKLIEADVDCVKSIILLNNVELQEKTNISYLEAKLVLDEAAAVLVEDRIKTALEIPDWTRLSSGCKQIDCITRGGFPANGITEIYGCGGVGKTQLCLQLSLIVQFPINVGGFGRGAVYISTEDLFPTKRLLDLAKLLPKRLNINANPNFEKNVFVEHAADYEQLRRFICVRLKHLLDKTPIGLVIIDSIAGAFRGETESVNYVQRSEELYNIHAKLCELSRNYNLVVICTNQVTENPHTSQLEPSLGHAWGNLITCRFEISRTSHERAVRKFEVINAPDLPDKSCNFLITESGITDMD